jgi:hypothetical protein
MLSDAIVVLLDKSANFALKMSLGFALHPTVEVVPTGERSPAHSS